jgi:hypothetical protein
MAFTNKPTYIPEWATDDVYNAETETYNVATPDAAKIELGWDAYEKPPRNYMNWLQRGNYLWINYFNQFFGDSHELLVDVIEPNGASGVTIDGVLCKDGVVTGDLVGDVTGNADTVTNGVYTTGAQTVAGVKTFSSTIVGSIDSVKETGSAGATIRTKIIEIGDWNMDSTGYVEVAHGLTFSKIRKVSALIRNDENNFRAPLEGKVAYINGAVTDCFDGGSIGLYSTNVLLCRIASGHFDSTAYNSTSYNRGWITIEYVD